ncbi:TPA: dihydroorotate dehydrogenase [Candidatus Micrarchaeota archaeon]|nr:dihydroorotate dehydrogenase [Candidatus Micrarchaeota archaeon]HIH30212.1 dihydroorotate dehydrogenase [Candidatus Micrarchaeota archaeon]
MGLETQLCKMKLRNPTVLASGIRGNNAHLLIRAAKEGAGAVTSKSCSLAPREGHNNPTMINTPEAMLNAIGLSNPGVEEEIGEIRAAVMGAKVPVIASIVAFSIEDFGKVAERISEAAPHMIEVDAACPNTHREGRMFSACAQDAAAVAKAVEEATNIPFSMKLSPDVPNIGEIAQACVDAGADAITAINTMGGMYVDAYARRAVLHNWFGGVSGPALKPVALKAVYNIRKAVGPKIPIIGTGGISTGMDAIEMIMAGANAVGIGSAVVLRKNVFKGVCSEMSAFMKEKGYKRLYELKLEE